MSDTVNVLNPELRKTIKMNIPSISGAWIKIYNDLTYGQIKEAQAFLEKEKIDFDFLLPQIVDWNFSDASGKKLPINENSFLLLNTNLLKEIAKLVVEAFTKTPEEEKKSTEGSDNNSTS